MAALTFVTAAKNAYLDAIIRGVTNPSAYSIANATYGALRVATAGNSTLIGSGAAGTICQSGWGSATGGVADFSFSFTPTTGTAALIEWVHNNGNTIIASGTITTTGGGGNVIAPSLSFNGSTVILTTKLKVPLNNGGTLRFNTALANQTANMILTQQASPFMCNGGVMDFYDGTQPATADTAITTQNKLASYTFVNNTEFTAASAGNCPLSATKTVGGIAAGTMSWFRWTKGAYVIDGSVGTAGTDAVVSTTTAANGVNFSLTNLTLTFP